MVMRMGPLGVVEAENIEYQTLLELLYCLVIASGSVLPFPAGGGRADAAGVYYKY